MTTLVILRGAPGCGKSTIAAEYAADGYEIVNRDTIRLKQFGDEEFFGEENLVTALQDTLIDYWLRKSVSVVVDNTNTRWEFVRALAGIGLRSGAAVKIEVVDVPLDEVLRRNAQRGRLGGRAVPEHVIRRYWDELQISKDWTL
jgi:predicted kinase